MRTGSSGWKFKLYHYQKLGRHFLGFEISPEYCRIAEERIALVEMQPNLFQPKPEQLILTK
jgi:DNA modification methylase